MNIKDIAGLCGVSVSTVSKVLNHKDADISKETRKKVMDIVAEYQYVPFASIRKQPLARKNLVGVLVGKKTEGLQHIINGIEQNALKYGYNILVSNTSGNPENIVKQIRILQGKLVDGIILLDYPENIDEISEVPILQICTEGKMQNIKKQIFFSMEEAGYLATKELIKKGHMKIGCLLTQEDSSVEKGYIKALHENNIPFDASNVVKNFDTNEVIEYGIVNGVAMEVTAYLCGNSDIACGLYKKISEQGMLIPNDISVISVRNNHICDILSPKLTSIALPYKQLGKQALEILLKSIEDEKTEEDIVKVDIGIIDRNSIAMPPVSRQGKKMVVVGTINQDIMINVPRIPTEGETMLSHNIVISSGGKGANQAINAGKMGGVVYLIGKLGADAEGKNLYSILLNQNVKMDGISFESNSSTGKAYITVSEEGDSTIVVYPGANRFLTNSYIKRHEKIFEGSEYCLLSLEIPEQTAEYVIKMCQKYNIKILLKPASVNQISEEWLNKIEYFIPNEKEIMHLVREGNTIEEKANYLFEKGVKNIIVTLGNKGCYLKNGEYSLYFPAMEVEAKDTTGAADIFISTLAVFLSEGNLLIASIGFATYAAGLSVTRYGVQNSIQDRCALDVYQEEINSLFNERR